MSNNPPTLGALVSNTSPAHLPGPDPLTGQHVTLERLTQDHYAELYEHVGAHEELWTWWPEGPFSAPAFNDYLDRHVAMGPELVIYAAIPRSGARSGKAVGLGFALADDRANRVAELGLVFGPALQRTRAGTEVVYLLAGLVFGLEYRRVQWKTSSLNVASRRAAERYGFVYEGTFRQHQINKGRNRDSSWYSIIDSEWPVCRKAFEMWLEDGNFDELQQQRRRIEEIREGLK